MENIWSRFFVRGHQIPKIETAFAASVPFFSEWDCAVERESGAICRRFLASGLYCSQAETTSRLPPLSRRHQ
jgi:hypothetical protein